MTEAKIPAGPYSLPVYEQACQLWGLWHETWRLTHASEEVQRKKFLYYAFRYGMVEDRQGDFTLAEGGSKKLSTKLASLRQAWPLASSLPQDASSLTYFLQEQVKTADEKLKRHLEDFLQSHKRLTTMGS